jgi:glycosyltransferase involved in cell wall biosynthesis
VVELTLVIPYYRNISMLSEQVRMWNDYPPDLHVILVDDGSPEEALPVVEQHAAPHLWPRLEVYRIDKDVAWNRGGARNLGSTVAQSDWIMHIDIDHVLRPDCAARLMAFEPYASRWYRFPRFRRGAADETRNKDALARSVKYGPVKPHIDSYLCTREMYWRAGGYNEDFSGCLGGGSPFLQCLAEEAAVDMAPDDVFLEVYTRDTVKDASDFSLSRETSEFTRRKTAMGGNLRGKNPLRFTWKRVA